MSTPQLVRTADGSHTLKSSVLGDCYHSENGALQESLHVFIEAGLKAIDKKHINILEVGFGTGLNALLTLLEAEKMGISIYYESVEHYPIDSNTAELLNYCELLGVDKDRYFMPLHHSEWGVEVSLSNHFTLKKLEADLTDYTPQRTDFDLIYFDAFAHDTQPELWTTAVFTMLYQHLSAGGVLVTYSSKGLVKQHLREAGFTLKRLAGAAGKRHMLRAVKPVTSA